MEVLGYILAIIVFLVVCVLMIDDVLKRVRYATIEDILDWYMDNQESEIGLLLEWKALTHGYSIEEYVDMYYVTDLIVYIRKELI